MFVKADKGGTFAPASRNTLTSVNEVKKIR